MKWKISHNSTLAESLTFGTKKKYSVSFSALSAHWRHMHNCSLKTSSPDSINVYINSWDK